MYSEHINKRETLLCFVGEEDFAPASSIRDALVDQVTNTAEALGRRNYYTFFR